jgi:hypothetical protein
MKRKKKQYLQRVSEEENKDSCNIQKESKLRMLDSNKSKTTTITGNNNSKQDRTVENF